MESIFIQYKIHNGIELIRVIISVVTFLFSKKSIAKGRAFYENEDNLFHRFNNQVQEIILKTKSVS